MHDTSLAGLLLEDLQLDRQIMVHGPIADSFQVPQPQRLHRVPPLPRVQEKDLVQILAQLVQQWLRSPCCRPGPPVPQFKIGVSRYCYGQYEILEKNWSGWRGSVFVVHLAFTLIPEIACISNGTQLFMYHNMYNPSMESTITFNLWTSSRMCFLRTLEYLSNPYCAACPAAEGLEMLQKHKGTRLVGRISDLPYWMFHFFHSLQRRHRSFHQNT